MLQLAQEWGVPIEERSISIGEIATYHAGGTLQEVFGSGTAATISPIGELNYKGTALEIVEPEHSLRRRLYDTITAIMYGESADDHGWMTRVEEFPTLNGTAHHANGKGEEAPGVSAAHDAKLR